MLSRRIPSRNPNSKARWERKHPSVVNLRADEEGNGNGKPLPEVDRDYCDEEEAERLKAPKTKDTTPHSGVYIGLEVRSGSLDISCVPIGLIIRSRATDRIQPISSLLCVRPRWFLRARLLCRKDSHRWPA